MNTRRIGDRGEDFALSHLTGMGYELVERNYRSRRGEIDLILRDADTLVFVEVKLRRGTGFGDPLESVTPRKQLQVRSIAREYLAQARPKFSELRFDVVGILLSGGRPALTHVKDAF